MRGPPLIDYTALSKCSVMKRESNSIRAAVLDRNMQHALPWMKKRDVFRSDKKKKPRVRKGNLGGEERVSHR